MRYCITTFVLFLLSQGIFGQDLPTKVISGTTGSVTWSQDTIYILRGFVRIDNGERLTIEKGTIIKAEGGQFSNASALVVERDGYIDAQGTAEKPIIFTTILDNVNDPDDLLNKQLRGEWGGIIICGDASTNTANNGNAQIEGIPTNLPASVGTYGGNEDDDDSGILRYVSIRHTGQVLASNNEIQGLTLAGVGSKTTIEYVESYASDDDGIEIFGGTVNLKNICIAFARDDAFDLDQGWRGNIQWLFVLQSSNAGDRLGEWDGADSPEDGTPYGIPTMSNLTMIGNLPEGSENRLITFRANGGGKVYNSIFMEQHSGVDVQLKGNGNVRESSFDRLQAGDLQMENNIFWNVADNDLARVFRVNPVAGGWGSDSGNVVTNAIAEAQTYFAANNVIVNPEIQGLSYTNDRALDPRFSANAVYANIASTPNAFFTPTNYKGAFGPKAEDLWIKGWTALDHYGYVVETPQDVVSIEKTFDPIEGLEIYPNPTDGIFLLKAEKLGQENVEMNVWDISGRIVYSKTIQPVGRYLQTLIDIQDFPASVYMISVKQGNKFSSQRLVKH